MAASTAIPATTQEQTTSGGVRPVRLRQDLGAIADLIELAFGNTMDVAGQNAVRELRTLSRSGALIWLLASLDRGVRSMSKGFVWIDPDTGKLAGNVSIYETDLRHTLVIANVAVHPDYRRRGIALALMEAAMTMAEHLQAKQVLLQVEAENEGAQRLYYRTDFVADRRFTRWHWYPGYTKHIPDRRPGSLDITLRAGHEWKAIYTLAQHTRPDSAGGLGWLRPTQPSTFKRSLSERLLTMMGFQSRQWWVMRHPESASRIVSAMSMQNTFGARHRPVELLIDREYRNQVETDMIGFAMRQVADQRQGLMIEHPADDTSTVDVLREYRFEARRHLLHMRWQAGT